MDPVIPDTLKAVIPSPAIWLQGYPSRHIKSQIDKLVYTTNLPRDTWKFGRNRLNILALKRPILRHFYRTLALEHYLFAKLKRVIDVWKDQNGGDTLQFEAFGLEPGEPSILFRKVVAGYLLATQYTRDLGLQELDENAMMEIVWDTDMEVNHDELLAELRKGLDMME
jgi:hypothetical protein